VASKGGSAGKRINQGAKKLEPATEGIAQKSKNNSWGGGGGKLQGGKVLAKKPASGETSREGGTTLGNHRFPSGPVVNGIRALKKKMPDSREKRIPHARKKQSSKALVCKNFLGAAKGGEDLTWQKSKEIRGHPGGRIGK